MKALFVIFLSTAIAGCSGMGMGMGHRSSGTSYGSGSESPLGNMASDGYLLDENRPFPASPP